MKNNLYEEIMAAMHEGNSKEDILSLVNAAETQVKEENNATKVALDDARVNYIEATYNYYKALGVPVEKKELEEVAKLTESLAKLKDTFTDIIKQESEEDTDNDYSTILKFIKNI